MNHPSISIEEFESTIAYIRFRGTYLDFRRNSRRLFNQLFAFAQAENLVLPNETKVLTIYHDNPFVTEASNLRTSVAMTVPNGASVPESGEISVMTIAGKYGVGHFEIAPHEYQAAWHYMYDEWLFKSTEKPRDSFPFELYVTEPPKDLKQKSQTDIYVPIE